MKNRRNKATTSYQQNSEYHKNINAGRAKVYPCKRYDKDGNLIEEISIDAQLKATPKQRKTLTQRSLDKTVARDKEARKDSFFRHTTFGHAINKFGI
jgi:hypothetical protein